MSLSIFDGKSPNFPEKLPPGNEFIEKRALPFFAIPP